MQKSLSFDLSLIFDLSQRAHSATPQFSHGLHSWFLLDRVRGEKTLTAFFQDDSVVNDIQVLLSGTAHVNLIELSPLLIKLNDSDLSASTYDAIQKEASGIFFQSASADILAHLQYLFIMDSERQGPVYARYYDPFFWIGLQLSLPDQQRAIWGNIQTAHTLIANDRGQPSYIAWEAPAQAHSSATLIDRSKPILLTETFYDICDEIKRLNLLYRLSAQANITVTDERMRRALGHFKWLNDAGITRPDLLKRLVAFCAERNDFSGRPEVRAILAADSAPYEKVDALEDLFKEIERYEQ